MLAAWDKRKDWNSFPLCKSTVFKLTSEEPISKRHSIGLLVSNSVYNTENIITKYQIVYLIEKFFEFILAIAKQTYGISGFW